MKPFFALLALFFTVLAQASALSSTAVVANPVIKLMANGMKLAKPAFVAEAKVQASVLGSGVDIDQVSEEIKNEVSRDKIVVYTYGLSPFSSEALSILDKGGYEYNNIELGAEWFLLGGKNSVKRVVLSNQVENGATSLPKVFIGGKCIGGCAELAEAAESGTLDALVSKAGTKSGNKKLFSLF
mmetsp:Transcript_1449/g.3959  ORF Transcript_1449/g.3959 Transcript_1449/m.3959 type:complete len:184 (-) Transcript_1449:51-602(-)|eukprot:CAMPEP_0168723292 /NCGR_PEP_ID=MMETSP0724-20121128/3040_1 /TAXON_ID=265536 /ORGANISM="Amphiprora sp., Strain CCMP467" /LENGTH=183 /DNA_ID=CAMNT_0008769995 /DNA_START=41 /DNA_END=592 /DNA_ORIENTATION=-